MAGIKAEAASASNQGIAAIKPQTVSDTSTGIVGLSAAPTALKVPYTPPAPVVQAPPTSLAANDFMSQWAQNVGGQFKDPYQNYLMTHGASVDIPGLLQQYQAAGNTGTPDWAALSTNMNQLPQLASTWDASGATPVPYLKAWNSTTPTIDTAPQDYWKNLLAYNTGASQWNPQQAIAAGTYDPTRFAAYNSGLPIEGSHGDIPNAGWISSYGAQGLAKGGKVFGESKQQELQRALQKIGKK